ncbi:sugar transferase [Devosia sp.]|uniref:sugar transferase n=1 Tax=Devosia sp. TaxID=1871048 RepID=UPI003BA9E174
MTDAVDGFDDQFRTNRHLGVSAYLTTDHEIYRRDGAGYYVERDQSGLSLTFIGGQPAAPVETRKRSTQLALKRVMDVVLAGGALVALSPLLLIVGLLIKLTSKGGVLFRQTRPGLNGEPFELLKFRTMRQDSCDLSGIKQTTAGDPRVTSVGRFLRATSIDELPQLWNIVKGDMSIIGPRPMVYGMLAVGRDYHELVPYYDYRLLMKPGLSGWAQANGLRGPTDQAASAKARIDHDCAYIQNFSVALDIKIIIQTLQREFVSGSGL